MTGDTGVLLAAFRFEFAVVRRSFNDLMVLVTLPLITVAYLAILVESGRRDLAPYGIVGSAVTAVWSMGVYTSGGIVDDDRRAGTLEAIVATPSRLAVALVGRIGAVSLISLAGLAESAVIARFGFGIPLTVHHPLVFVLTLFCTVLAVAGTATALAAVFVTGRWVQTFRSSLTYPFYLLGGVLVPVSFLPGWIQPVSKVIFLSWASDLLRASLLPAPPRDVALGLSMVLVLGLAAFGAGLWALERVLDRLRSTGAIGDW